MDKTNNLMGLSKYSLFDGGKIKHVWSLHFSYDILYGIFHK